MIREALSHIDVVIVGAGLGGLYAAIECYRQGHSPRVIESKMEVEDLGQSSFIPTGVSTGLTAPTIGDFVGIGPSVTKPFQKWPGMPKTYSSIVYRPAMTLFAHDGTFVGGPFELSEKRHYRPVPVSRPKLIRALYDYAVSLGIPIIFDRRVVDYEESDDTNRAYAVTDRGEHFEADIVVAADGIGSKVAKVMIGKEVKAMSSGFSVYRVTYPTKLLQEDAFLAKQYPLGNGEPDYCQVYIGPKGQMIILVAPELTTWLFTHEVSTS
jgi:2-polyprenyl-6-methoxyphenol hydroxylase-like FAD-dependent oxidoreductase